MPNTAPKTEFNASAGVNGISSYPHEIDWKTDPQPSSKAVDEYIADAEALRLVFLEYVEGLIKEHAPDAILMVEKSVKEQKSALRKLQDEDIMGDPSRILDYLRAKIVIRASDNPDTAVTQINNLRNALMFDRNVTSYNDRFRRPCPEGGHRAFAAHILVGNDEGISQKAEIQITHEAFEYGPYDEAVKRIRNSIRDIAPCIKSDMRNKLGEHFLREVSVAYEFLQRARCAAHEEASLKYGLNALLDEDLLRQRENRATVIHLDAPKSRILTAAFGSRLQEAARCLGPNSETGAALQQVLK